MLEQSGDVGHGVTSQLNMFNTQRNKGFIHRSAAEGNRHKGGQFLLYTEAIIRDVSTQGKLLSTDTNTSALKIMLC